jgi:ABC exporter DevB family membrane fusion protein
MKSRHAILAVLLISLCVMAVQYQPYFTSYLTTMTDEVKPYVTRKIEVSSTTSSNKLGESSRIVASGWIEGRTPNVELSPRLAEQVDQILVREGDWVSQGAVLIMLDSSLYRAEESVAQAEHAEALARLNRLENGFRKSEIEAVRSEYSARVAELEGSKKNLKRLAQLISQQAASQQSYDDELSKMKSLEALAAAAKSRYETIAAPAREDELNAARAIVEAAKAKLELSRLNLDRTRIRAPIEGRILRINAELGEVTRPEDLEPLVIMSDIRQLHAVAEIDEFDALQMCVGQKASIKVDSIKGSLAQGTVVRIEPIMSQKQLNLSRPGAKVDSLSRRVWVALEAPGDLPIGLPVDVQVETNRPGYPPETAPNAEANVRNRQTSVNQEVIDR